MQQFLALTSPGIEILLAEELKRLKRINTLIQKPEGVYFQAQQLEQAYKICTYIGRLATRMYC